MENSIEYFDNIIPEQYSNYLEDITINSNNLPLIYRPNIANSEASETFAPGFAHTFFSKVPSKSSNYRDVYSHVLYLLCHHLNIAVHTVIQGRVFMQIPYTPSEDGDIHVDMNSPHWVCLYYINDSDGDTVFYNDRNEEIRRVSPKKGRVVFFDGSVKHRSSVPSKNHRFVININFIGTHIENTRN